MVGRVLCFINSTSLALYILYMYITSNTLTHSVPHKTLVTDSLKYGVKQKQLYCSK